MAVILTVILVGQYFLYSRLGIKNLGYNLTISRDEAFEGEEIEITEEIENRKILPLPWIRTEISCSRWLSFYGVSQDNSMDGQKGLISSVFILKGYQKCRRVWRVKCEKRGIFSIEDVSVVASDLFGLTKPSMVVKLQRKIRVLPSPAEVNMGELSRETYIGNNPVKRFVLPDPFMISGAKEYTGREPMNRIHWKQTARLNSPMVYNNDFTTERELLLIINMQRNFLSTTQKLTVSSMETQIKGAAFVVDYCYKNGIRSAAAANSGEGIITDSGEGYSHAVELLRVFAELENSCGEHIDDFIEKPDYEKYTDIVLITGFLSGKTEETLRKLNESGKGCLILSTDIEECSCCEVCHIPREKYYPPEGGAD